MQISPDRLPAFLRNNRLFLSPEKQPDRSIFNELDWQLDFFHRFAGQVLGRELTLLSFYSSLCRISVVNGDPSPGIAWDEHYFDHLFDALILIATADQEYSVRTHQLQLFTIVAERRLVTRPHLAMILSELCLSLWKDKHQFLCPPAVMHQLENIFRLIRNFCLLHEIGHIITANPEHLQVELANLEIIRSVYSDPRYGQALQTTVLTGKPSGPHLTALAGYASRKDVEHELCADLFALRTLIDFEFDFVTKHHDRYGDIGYRYFGLLVIEAMTIFHYFQSDVLVSELTLPRKIEGRRATDDEDMRTTLNATRGDMRIYLACRYVMQKLGDDIAAAEALEMDRGNLVVDFSAIYRANLLPAIIGIKQLDLSHLADQERTLRAKAPSTEGRELTLRNLGW
jgi:hypothetical protein